MRPAPATAPPPRSALPLAALGAAAGLLVGLPVGLLAGPAIDRLGPEASAGAPSAGAIPSRDPGPAPEDPAVAAPATRSPFATVAASGGGTAAAAGAAPPALARPAPTERRPDAYPGPTALARELDGLAAAGPEELRRRADAFEPRSSDLLPRVRARALFGRWAALDVDAALARLDAVGIEAALDPRTGEASTAFAEAYRAVAGAAPRRAAAWLEARGGDWPAEALRTAAAVEAGAADPGRALLGLGAHDPATWPIAERWSRADPAAALAWLETEAGPALRDGLSGPMFEAMLGADPERALRVAALVDDAHARSYLRGRYAGRLAEDDPAAALAWIEAEADSAARRRAIAEVAMRWAEADPAAVRERLLGEPDPALRRDLIEGASWMLGETLLEGGAPSAWSWSATLTAPERELLEPRMLERWLYEDPRGAGDWLEARARGGWTDDTGLPVPEGVRRQLVDVAASQLPNVDPARALALHRALPESERRRLEPGLALALARDDPAALERWSATLPAGPAREIARLARAGAAASADPAGWLADVPGLDFDARVERYLALSLGLAGEGADDALRRWTETHPPSAAERAALDRRMTALYGGY